MAKKNDDMPTKTWLSQTTKNKQNVVETNSPNKQNGKERAINMSKENFGEVSRGWKRFKIEQTHANISQQRAEKN